MSESACNIGSMISLENAVGSVIKSSGVTKAEYAACERDAQKDPMAVLELLRRKGIALEVTCVPEKRVPTESNEGSIQIQFCDRIAKCLWISRKCYSIVVRFISLVAFIAFCFTIHIVNTVSSPESLAKLYWAIGVWAVVPPFWFWFEYFYLYPSVEDDTPLERFKYGQDVAKAIWAGIFAVLVAYAASDSVKSSTLAGKEIARAISTTVKEDGEKALTRKELESIIEKVLQKYEK